MRLKLTIIISLWNYRKYIYIVNYYLISRYLLSSYYVTDYWEDGRIHGDQNSYGFLLYRDLNSLEKIDINEHF